MLTIVGIFIMLDVIMLNVMAPFGRVKHGIENYDSKSFIQFVPVGRFRPEAAGSDFRRGKENGGGRGL